MAHLKHRWLVLAVVLLFALAGCGGRIDTVLAVNPDGSGVRTMTVTVSAADLAEIPGGAPALDVYIAAHLPPALTYSGSTPTGDGGATTTFTLYFDSIDDYQARVSALLNPASSSYVDFSGETRKGPLGSSISWYEGFTSSDLLAWLPADLVDDGYLTPDQAAGFFTTGTTELAYDGVMTQTDAPMLNAELGRGSGFDYVTMETTVLTDPAVVNPPLSSLAYERTISYGLMHGVTPDEAQTYADFIRSVAPPGATVEPSETTPITLDDPSPVPLVTAEWRLRFTAATLTDLAADTAIALASDQVRVSLSPTALGPALPGPGVTRLELDDYAECSQICAPNSVTVPETWTFPASWRYVDQVWAGTGMLTDPISSVDGTTLYFEPFPEMTYLWEYSAPVDHIDASTVFAPDGSVTVTVAVTVPQSTADTVGASLQAGLRPLAGGTMSVTTAAGQVTYTATLHAQSAQEYVTRVGTFGGSYAQWSRAPRDFWHRTTTLDLSMPLADWLGGNVTLPVTYHLELPTGQTIQSAQLELPSGTTDLLATAHAATWEQTRGEIPTVHLTIATYDWLNVALVGIAGMIALAAAVIVLVRFRKYGRADGRTPATPDTPTSSPFSESDMV